MQAFVHLFLIRVFSHVLVSACLDRVLYLSTWLLLSWQQQSGGLSRWNLQSEPWRNANTVLDLLDAWFVVFCLCFHLQLRVGTYCGPASTINTLPCRAGAFCPSPSQLNLCPAGTFGNVQSATTQSVGCPGSCPPNSNTLPGATTLKNCTCASGFRSFPVFVLFSRRFVCISGPAGGTCLCTCSVAGQTCNTNFGTCGSGFQSCTCWSNCVGTTSAYANCTSGLAFCFVVVVFVDAGHFCLCRLFKGDKQLVRLRHYQRRVQVAFHLCFVLTLV